MELPTLFSHSLLHTPVRVAFPLFLSLAVVASLSCGPVFPLGPGAAAAPEAVPAPPLQVIPGPATRPFFIGFTLWPADLSAEGLQTAEEFAHRHGDIVSITFIGGIPWVEALEGKPFSADVEKSMSYRPPAGKKLFLSISPLDKDRRGLAAYWGERDNMPLPRPWDKETLNSPRVKKAFQNFVLRCVKTMEPDFLAIGVESNILLAREPTKWRQFKELYRDTYRAVKKAHPAVPVFFTTDVLHYKRLTIEAKGTEQESEVADLMKDSDLFAMSLYPHMSAEVPRPLPANFLEFATRFKKPVAVAESGMTSRNVLLRSYGTTLRGSEAEQQQFTELLLDTAARDGYDFVINFATTDFDRLVAKLPPRLADIARIWAYTGMQTSDKKPKPALTVWEGFFRAKLVRVW